MTPDALVDAHMDWATGIARSVHRRLPPSFELDDLIQVAHIALWRASEKYDADKGVKFTDYAYRSVQGACWMLTRRRNYTDATCDELHDQPVASPEARVIQWEQYRQASEHIRSLPHMQRRVLRLHYEDGVPMSEVAERVGRGVTTVYSLRARGLRSVHMAMIQNELEQISQRIKYQEQQAQGAAKLAIQHKLEIGRDLVKAKELLPHGEFGRWAEQEFGWTRQHIAKHIRLARNVTRGFHLTAETSLRMALLAIAEPRNGKAAPVVEAEQVDAHRWRLTGEVDCEDEEPAVEALVASCHEWKVKRV